MRFPASLLTLLCATAFLLPAGLIPAAADDAFVPLTPAVAMPAFKLTGLNNTRTEDADLRNKVTIIRFWASW